MAQTYDFDNQLTRYPSTFKSTNELGLALAEDITYSVESYDAGDNETAYKLLKSVKDLIDELLIAANKVDTIETAVNNIDVAAVSNAKNDAESAALRANISRRAAETALESALDAKSDVDALVVELSTKLNLINSQLIQLQSIADDLSMSFLMDANIEVITQDLYDAIENFDSNTIYFIYSLAAKVFTVTGIPNNPLYGTIEYKDGSNNAYPNTGALNTQTYLKAVPNVGFEWEGWYKYSGTSTNHSVANSNPLSITITEDAVYVATFNAIEYEFTTYETSGGTEDGTGVVKATGNTATMSSEQMIEIIIVSSTSTNATENTRYYIEADFDSTGTDASVLYSYDGTDFTDTGLNIKLNLSVQ